MKLKTNQQPYSVKRLYFLVRNRLLDDISPILIVAAAFLALNLLFLLSAHQYTPGTVGSWALIIAVGGIFLAGNGFSKMHDGKAGTEWLLLPASTLEKYTAALVMYLIVYPVFAALLAFFESLICSGIGYLMHKSSLWLFNPLTAIIWENYLNYAFFVVLALAGSARFRKFAVGKTAAIMVSFMLLASLLLVLGALLFDSEGRQILYNGIRGHSIEIQRPLTLSKESSLKILGNIFLVGTGLFALVYGYALVREKEARDEVQ